MMVPQPGPRVKKAEKNTRIADGRGTAKQHSSTQLQRSNADNPAMPQISVSSAIPVIPFLRNAHVTPGTGQAIGSAPRKSATIALATPPPAEREYFNARKDAEARVKYYSSIDANADPTKLFDTLSALLSRSHTRRLGYRQARMDYLYPWVDLKPGDLKLHGIYSNEVFSSQAIVAKDLAIESNVVRRIIRTISFGTLGRPQYNTEHAVPQSWFARRSPMRGDLHALFTATPRCNSMRGSVPFGQVDGRPRKSDDCGKVTATAFQPRRGYSKGAVARATLYFLLRYPNEIDAGEMPQSRIKTLLRWHKEFPPDLWEKHRNAEIAKVQGNRNPLIDRPSWAESIKFRVR